MLRDSRSNPGSGSGPPRYPGTFLLAVREAVDHLNWKVQRWMGDSIRCVDAEGEEHTVGLENLFRRTRRQQRDTWPAYIAEFLTKVRASEENAAEEIDLAAVGDRLMVRLGQPFAPLPNDLSVWAQPLEGTDLEMNLVIDHEETMSYVTAEMVEKSGRPGEEWLRDALANLRARTPEDCIEPIHEESGLSVCTVGDAYDASRALLVEDLLGDQAPLGCFVALPGRDELLILPVNKTALAHVHLLRVLADKNFKSAPYPISDQVFWVQQGRWHVFPIDIRGNDVTIRPPEAFVPIFDQLSPEEAETPPDAEAGPDPSEPRP
jgi:hypothetical protein